jgi:hypothetical protein
VSHCRTAAKGGREDAIQALLDTDDAEVLFAAGCEDNQVKFHPQFDRIIC